MKSCRHRERGLVSVVLITILLSGASVLVGQEAGSQRETAEISSPGVRKALQGGRYWLARESYPRAAQYFERCHQLAEGRSLECLVGLAKVHNALEQYDLAVSYARLATALGGDGELLAQAFNQLGLALFRPLQARWEQERNPQVRYAVLDQAEAAFRSALGLLPDDPWLVLNLATVLAARWMMAEEQVHHAELEGLLKRVLQDSPGEDNESWAREVLADMGIAVEQEPLAEVASQEPMGVNFEASELVPGEDGRFFCNERFKTQWEARVEAHDGSIGDGEFDGPILVGGDVVKPERIHNPQPSYTEAARKARIQGVLITQVVIDTDGRVRWLKVLKGLPLGLDRATAETICTWRFRPATLSGRPVMVYYNLTTNFRLQ